MQYQETITEYKVLTISSEAFQANGSIPARYTCDGENINPPLHILDIPERAKSLALIVEDPDAPAGPWLHWLVWNMPITHHIMENDVPGAQGRNDFGSIAWGGPCPPSGRHRYFFKVYALNDLLDLPEGASKKELEMAMDKHILAYGELVGVYQRNR